MLEGRCHGCRSGFFSESVHASFRFCCPLIVLVQTDQKPPFDQMLQVVDSYSQIKCGVAQLVPAFGTALLADRGLKRIQLAGGSCSAQPIGSSPLSAGACGRRWISSVASSPPAVSQRYGRPPRFQVPTCTHSAACTGVDWPGVESPQHPIP